MPGTHHPHFRRLRPHRRFSTLRCITGRRLVALQLPRFASRGLCASKCLCLPAIAARTCLFANRVSVSEFLRRSRHAPRILYDPAAPPAALARPAIVAMRRLNVVASSSFHHEMALQHTLAATVGPPARRTPPPGYPATPCRLGFRSRRFRATSAAARSRRACANVAAWSPFPAEMAFQRTFQLPATSRGTRRPPPGYQPAACSTARRLRRLRRRFVAYSSNAACRRVRLCRWYAQVWMSC
jgi:hypothetical protein